MLDRKISLKYKECRSDLQRLGSIIGYTVRLTNNYLKRKKSYLEDKMSAATLTKIEAVHLTEAEEDFSDLEEENNEVLEYTDSGDEETTRSEIEDRHSTTSSSIDSITQNELALKYLEFQKKKIAKDKTPSTIVNFFTNLGETVSTFPAQVQSRVKAAVFRIVNDEEAAMANQGSQLVNQLMMQKKEGLVRQSSTVITHPTSGVMKTSSSMASISSDGTQVSMSYNVSAGNEIMVAPKYCQ